MGIWGIRVRMRMQVIGVRMWRIRVGVWGRGVGMQGPGDGNKGNHGENRWIGGIKIKWNVHIYKNIVLTLWLDKQLKKLI